MTATARPARRRIFLVILAWLVCSLTALPGHAQELYNYTVSVLGGLGGAPGSDTDDDLGNGSFQVNFSAVLEPSTHLGLRLGRLGFDGDVPQGGLFDSELTYATVAGEYRYREAYYDSGIYFGLGGYRLDGTDFLGRDDDDTAVGAVLGVTGEFEISRRFAVLVELSGHYTDLDAFDLLVMGHAGLSIHFR